MAWGRTHTAAQKPAWNQDDYHAEFAGKLKEQIEQGVAPWQKPWLTKFPAPTLPWPEHAGLGHLRFFNSDWPLSTKELRLSKSGSNSSIQTGYRVATNTWLRKHRRSSPISTTSDVRKPAV